METERIKKLKANLQGIEDRIAQACARGGRDRSEVTLVAVTKKVEPDIAGLLLHAGQEHIGENRVQETERKRAVLGDKGTWHMIGHLQTNKVKKIVPLVSVIHSVDSIRLMKEISKQCEARGLKMDLLFEVNVSREASKFGMAPEDLDGALQEAARLPAIRVRGLMTMAPYDPDPEAARPFFKSLKNLLDQVRPRAKNPDDFNQLSMGMSGDFEPAVEEGATLVRVGTSLYEGLDLY